MLFTMSETSGSQSNEHEDGCLLGCCTLMMEAASTSEKLVNLYLTTWCNNPEDRHLIYSSLQCKMQLFLSKLHSYPSTAFRSVTLTWLHTTLLLTPVTTHCHSTHLITQDFKLGVTRSLLTPRYTAILFPSLQLVLCTPATSQNHSSVHTWVT
jgi:hypothetical protein